MSVLSRLRKRVEDPLSLAGPDVEAADVALHILAADRSAAHLVGGADEEGVTRHDRRGVQAHFAGHKIDLLVQPALQVDDAVEAEVGNLVAGRGVERDQLVSRRDVKNASGAPIVPVGQASARQPARRLLPALSLVEPMHPEQLARHGVECRHRAPPARRRVHHAVHHERRALEVELGPRTETVGLEGPGQFEIVEVLRRDLIERRVAGTGQVAAVGRPLLVWQRLLRGRVRRRHDEHQKHQEPCDTTRSDRHIVNSPSGVSMFNLWVDPV